MPTLYLTEQGSSLHKKGETLIIEKDGALILEVECHRIDTVLIFGNVQVTTQALIEIMEKGIELALLSMNGRLRGQLTPPLPKNIILRVKQYERLQDQDFVLRQAKYIIRVKIQNCLEVLKQADWNTASKEHLEQRSALSNSIKNCEQAENLDILNGVEGAASRCYFSALPVLLKAEGIEFNGRKRRPPPDPVNAILSFGYTLLCSKIQAVLDASGFDPYLGLLHQVSYGRPSLALDLLEPYRAPIVDRLAVKIFNLRILKPDDFTVSSENGCRLTPESLKKFFAEWEKNLRSTEFETILKEQVESLARAIKGEQEYPNHYLFKAR